MVLSIVIPVYNGEKYIEECLSSIFVYQGNDIEVIAINDGSKDKSAAILDEFARKEPRLKVVHKENGGVSAARNMGLQEASGDWILFVDIDDLMDNGGMDAIMECIQNEMDAEIIFGNYIEVSEDNQKLWDFPVADKIAENLDRMNEQLLCGYLLNACWGKLYRKEIIEKEKLSFDHTMKMGEDLKFVAQYCRSVTKIAGVHQSIYRYRQLSSGAVLTNRSKLDDANIRDFIKTIVCKQEYACYRNVSEEMKNMMNREFASNISANLNLMIKADGTCKEKIEKTTRFMEEEVISSIMKSVVKDSQVSFKRKLMGKMITKRLSRNLYVRIKNALK